MRTLFLVSLLCLTLPVPAAALGKIGLTQAEQDRRFDTCRTADNPERCYARLERYKVDSPYTPKVVDREEFRIYKTRLRQKEINERLHNSRQELAKRTTLRTLGDREDINTERLDYLQSFRQRTLECMEKPAGRHRTQCLVLLRDELRTASDERRAAIAAGEE